MAKQKRTYTSQQIAIIRRKQAEQHRQHKLERAPANPGRLPDGRVPHGRTLSTRDGYLPGGKKTGSDKKRPVVVIESKKNGDLAVVPLSSRDGANRTRLPHYQQGQSYFKHYVEIEDDEGKPIRINEKFRENHSSMDVSSRDVEKIRFYVFKRSVPMQGNNNKAITIKCVNSMENKKSPRD